MNNSDALDVSVIVPTFCEALNLPLLVPRVSMALSQAGLRGEIVVVDDDSPDDTSAVCEDLARAHPLRLLVRKGERGLGTAVLHGIAQARGEVIVVMDADLSHPPEKMPDLVAAIRSGGADFAIGSRFVPQGSTDKSWGWYRWMNAQVARWLARPLVRAADPGAGFFAIHRATLAKAPRLNPIGFKVGLELVVRCSCRRIKEIPIHFQDRRLGSSKLTLREQFDYLRHLWRLYVFKFTSLR
jgi:dolichol-phosphate mannosyltransferase